MILVLAAGLLLTGCADSAKAYASDKTLGVEDFFSLFHVTEDGTLLWIDGLDENVLYDEDGKEYFEVDGPDYQVQVLVSEDKLNPKKITYEGGSTSGNVFSKWQEILEADGVNYKELVAIEDEKYFSIDEVFDCYKTIEINTDNFWDYFAYEECDSEDSFSGTDVTKPKKQKFLKYIGNDKIVTDFSSTIYFEGDYDYSMSLYIYDSDNNLVTEENNYFYNTENYQRSFDTDDINNISFPNTLEYWTYRDLDNSFSKYVCEGTLTLTNANGKLLIFDNLPSDDKWNETKNGDKYLAIKLEDSSVVRIFKDFGYINPSDFSAQEKNFYEGFSSTLTLQSQIDKTYEKIINNCKGFSEYDGLSDDDILSKYKDNYEFSFGSMKILGNYSIDDF